jgi:hypothetical protein
MYLHVNFPMHVHVNHRANCIMDKYAGDIESEKRTGTDTSNKVYNLFKQD